MASGKLIPIIVLSFYVGLFISIVDTRNTYNHEAHSSKNTDNVSLLNYQILFLWIWWRQWWYFVFSSMINILFTDWKWSLNIPGNHIAFLSLFWNYGSMKPSGCFFISLENIEILCKKGFVFREKFRKKQYDGFPHFFNDFACFEVTWGLL